MSDPTPLLPIGARVASPAGVLGTVAAREDSRGWALVVLDVAQRGRTLATYSIDALRIVGMSGPAVVGARVHVMSHGRGVVESYHDGLDACTVVVRHDDGRTVEYVTESHEGDMLDTVVVLADTDAGPPPLACGCSCGGCTPGCASRMFYPCCGACMAEGTA